ncbi:HAD family hydrolase [Nocardia ignorata]|uniref:Phosphoglycolate phosphatase n=1 Tax=Nocardia ignorata TaxID=145285 RepID=A0A4R6PHC2_NOCIG|nr:HAD-IA family hydrolase [Nocardia ignorata]TDP37694.1 phosphoglycolate phosphatase [Nocardia ignorata]
MADLVNGERCRAVLFDLDGVLVESFEFWRALINHAAASEGLPAVSWQALRKSWGQDAEADAAEFLPGWSGRRLEEFYKCHLESFADLLVLNPHAAETFIELRSQGISTGLVTNSSKDFAALVLRLSGLAFDTVLTSDDLQRPKPYPEGILQACATVGAPPETAVYIGDSEYDRKAAAQAGVTFIWFGVGPRPALTDLRDLRQHVIEPNFKEGSWK